MAACAYCGTTMNRRSKRPNSATSDHIVPKSKMWIHEGFAFSLRWRNLNLVRVCALCNSRKSDMWPTDFLIVMPDYGVKFLISRLLALGCPQDTIDAAMLARTLATEAAKAYVGAIAA